MLLLLMLFAGIVYGGWMIISFILRLKRKLVYKNFWIYAVNLIITVGTAGIVFCISFIIAAFSVDSSSTPDYVPFAVMLVGNAIPMAFVGLSVIDIILRVTKVNKWKKTNFYLENLSKIEEL